MNAVSKMLQVMCVCLLVAVSAQAAFISWDGDTSDNWTVVSNWEGNTEVPDGDDTARIWATSPNATVVYSGTSVTLAQLWVAWGSGTPVTGDLTLQSGADMTLSGGVALHRDGVFTCNGELYVGGYMQAYSNSVLTLNDDPGVAVDVEMAPSRRIDAHENSTLTLGTGVVVSTPSIWLDDTATAVFAPGSVVLGNVNADGDVSLSISGVVTGDVSASDNVVLTGTGVDITGNVTIRNSATGAVSGDITGDLWVQNSATATLGADITGTVTIQQSASATLGGAITGTIRVWETAGCVVNGTVDGNLEIGTTNALNRIGVSGVIDGDCALGSDDRLTVAGTVTNGVFSINGADANNSVTIESTAKIYSSSDSTWLYNHPEVTWMVGEDGSVGTWWVDRSPFDGVYDDYVRGGGSTNLQVDLTAYDARVHGTTLEVKLVSDIQDEGSFGSNMKFWNDGVEHTDVTYLSDGLFRINNIPKVSTGTVISIR